MNKLAVIMLLVGLAACSNKKTEEGREPAQTATPGAVVGSAAPRAPAPAGGNAAGGNAAGGNAAGGNAAGGNAAGGSTLTSYNAGCATPTAQAPALVCDAGQVDGCTGGLTSVHVCVTKDVKAGAPCTQQPALTCPAGQADACLHEPPQASNHVCVIVPKSTP